MPKSRSRAGFSWKQEIGGVPVWGILVAVVAIAGMLAVPAVVNATTPAAAPYVRPTDAFTEPEPAAEPLTVLFVGDSYSAGAGASDGSLRWTTVAAEELGWNERNVALGGTGYIVTSGQKGCGLDYCGTFSEAAAAAENVAPDVVVISGGRNDGAQADEATAVANTVSTISARWPDARVVVTLPIWDDDEAPEWMPAAVAAVRQGAESAGATILDLGAPLLGHPEWMVEDGVHPNDAGHQAIAQAFLAAWAAATPS